MLTFVGILNDLILNVNFLDVFFQKSCNQLFRFIFFTVTQDTEENDLSMLNVIKDPIVLH